MKFNTLFHIFPVVLLSTIGCIELANAQSSLSFKQQVVNQLNRAKKLARDRGFQLTHDYHIDELQGNQTGRIVLQLEADVTYVIVGVCDNDCQDLDMILLNEKGNIISEDIKSDAMPILTVSPQWSGNFLIGVKVPICHHSSCVYGLAVFGKAR